MTTQLIDPQAAAKIEAAKGKLRSGSWGGTETVCMMSAMVSGAKSTDDCVTAGWPEWLAEINVYLFDADVGVDDEDAADAAAYAAHVASASHVASAAASAAARNDLIAALKGA